MTTTTRQAPSMLKAPVYDVQRNREGFYVVVQLMNDGTSQNVSVGYKYGTSAWAKLGRMIARKQREMSQ